MWVFTKGLLAGVGNSPWASENKRKNLRSKVVGQTKKSNRGEEIPKFVQKSVAPEAKYGEKVQKILRMEKSKAPDQGKRFSQKPKRRVKKSRRTENCSVFQCLEGQGKKKARQLVLLGKLTKEKGGNAAGSERLGVY